ncbi:MAG: hypothetical protein JNJ85_13840, partial [Candidatus Kapabacteria bacterium]|nr:hypothetical protein [Candidatus Kapabacteria bacterium]
MKNIPTSFVELRFVQRILVIILLLAGVSLQEAKGQILAWDFNTHSGDSTSVFATTKSTGLQNSQISRGLGVSANALANSFSAGSWANNATRSSAITEGEYFQFTLQPTSGYIASLTTLDANFRRSGAQAPDNFEWQYSTDGTNFNTIGSSFTYTLTNTNGDAQTQINLSGISALQNILPSTQITFRLYAWNAQTASTTFSLGRLTGNDIAIGGSIYDGAALAFDGSDDFVDLFNI